MKFRIPKSQYGTSALVRNVGYRSIGNTPQGELNCVRPIGADYPRFHLYITEQADGYIFALHLDQKRPSYKGSTAHSGEYEGSIIEDEARRINSIARE